MRKILSVLGVLFLFACGNSVEKQQEVWELKKTTVNEYSMKYPYLVESINTQFAKATEIMDNAIQTTDEKEQIKLMKEANASATKGAIDKVSDLEKVIESVGYDIRNIKDDFTSEEFTKKTTFLLEDANNCIDKADFLLQNSYNSADSALMLFKKECSKLKKVERSLENHYREVVNNRPDETVDETTIQTNSSDSKTKNSSKKEAVLKCKKCGAKLEKGATKCKNCGAPVK